MKDIIEKIKVSEIKPNPNNPRSINEFQLEKLKKSITEFPEMLRLRPIVMDIKTNVALGGNMRLQALNALGIKETYVIKSDLSKKKENEFVIKDNVSFGSWNFPTLNNNYEEKILNDWGLNISFGDNEFDLQDFKSPSKDYEKPNSAHDDYSIFEIVMKHDVKVRFTDLLNEIKEKKKYDKIEDSIIHIINSYDKKRK